METETISREKLIWLAGLFDGEGHVGLISNGHKQPYPVPRCGISMCHEITMRTVSEILKKAGVKHSFSIRKADKGRLEFYQIQSHSYRSVLKWLNLMLPWLLTKRVEADMLRDFIEFRLAMTPSTSSKLSTLPNFDEFIARRHRLMEALAVIHNPRLATKPSETTRVPSSTLCDSME